MISKRKKKPDGDDEDYRLRTIAEAGEALRCSKRKIYELQREGRLEFVKLGAHNRVTERSLRRLLSEIFGGTT